MDGTKTYYRYHGGIQNNEYSGKQASFLRRSFFEKNSGAKRNENPGRSKNEFC